MNRKTALLLALSALLAHALMLHQDGLGGFAAPHESAHVAYRLARNWVQQGALAWIIEPVAQGPRLLYGGLESHPSPLLVVLAAVAERAYFPVTGFAQFAGLVAALGCLWFAASFAVDRSAGIIPPLLLVLSGGFASAAVSGTELPLAALGLTGSFVAFEHRRARRFTILLAALAAARPEGALLVGVLLAYFAWRRFREDPAERARRRRLSAWTCLPALAVLALAFGLHARDGSSLYGGFLRDLFTPEPGRLVQGLAYARDGLVATGMPLLLVFPLVALAAGKLSGIGLRALALAFVWCAAVVLEGGAEPEFALGFVPAWPLLAIAIQQGVLAALDTYQRSLEALSWAALIGVAATSALASKYPGDLGPLPVKEPHRAWMRETASPLPGREPALGRVALRDELMLGTQLRELGVWMQLHLPPERSVLTPWPGAIGYLSRTRVHDLLGRLDRRNTDAAGRTSLTRFWRRPVDVVAALEARPDYLVVGMLTMNVVRSRALPDALARELSTLDLEPSDTARRTRMRAVLEEYELVAVPPTRAEAAARMAYDLPFFVLRKRSIGPQLTLSAEVSDGRLVVDLDPCHEVDGMVGDLFPRLARLRIVAHDEQGRVGYVDPRGQLVGDPRISARINLLVRPHPSRPTRLFDGELRGPGAYALVRRLEIELWNPGTRGGHALARIGRKAAVDY